jgi:hypothetical protein
MVAFSCGLDGFFTRLPGLYRHHHHCGRLLLAPILIGFWATLAEACTTVEIIQRIERIGRYLATNAWQPFFCVDVWLQTHRKRHGWVLLSFFDQWLAPVLRFRPLAIVLGWAAVLLFAGLVTPVVWLGEWWERGRRRGNQ